MPTTTYKEPRVCACGYASTDAGNWSKHKRLCKMLKQISEETTDETFAFFKEQLKAKDRQIEDQALEIKEQRAKIRHLERLQEVKIAELNAEIQQLRRRRKRVHRTEPERREIAKRQNWLCAGKDCPQALSGKELEAYDIDHIVPLSLGGTESLENLQALCPGCHRNKTDQERLVSMNVAEVSLS